MGMPVAPTFAQAQFRFRDVTVDPSGLNAAFSGDTAQNNQADVTVDELFRLRVSVDQTNASATSHSDLSTEFKLQFNHAGGGWTDVGTEGDGTAAVESDTSAQFSDGAATTELLSNTYTFIGGNGNHDNTTATVAFTDSATRSTELEFSLRINGSIVTDADEIQFRLLYSAGDEAPPATTMTYTVTPSLTVDKPAGPLTITVGAAIAETSSAVQPTSVANESNQTVTVGAAIAETSQAVQPTSVASQSSQTVTVAAAIAATSDAVQPTSVANESNQTVTTTAAIAATSEAVEPTSVSNAGGPQEISIAAAIAETSQAVTPTSVASEANQEVTVAAAIAETSEATTPASVTSQPNETVTVAAVIAETSEAVQPTSVSNAGGTLTITFGAVVDEESAADGLSLIYNRGDLSPDAGDVVVPTIPKGIPPTAARRSDQRRRWLRKFLSKAQADWVVNR